jgi:hypothetical protein
VSVSSSNLVSSVEISILTQNSSRTLTSIDYAVLFADLALIGRHRADRLVFFDESNRCTFGIRESEDGKTSILDYKDSSRLEVSVASKTLKRLCNLCLQSYEAGISPVGHYHLESDVTKDETTIWFPDFQASNAGSRES